MKTLLTYIGNKMKETGNRWQQSSPAYFKFIIKVAVTIDGLCLAILGLQSTVTLPPSIVSICTHGLVAGTIAAFISKLTVKDNSTDTTTNGSTKE